MKFLRLLKCVYLFSFSSARSAGEGKYLTGFITVYTWINGIFSSVHKSTVSTYTGMRDNHIRPNHQIKRQRHTFETWKFKADTDLLKASFPGTCCPCSTLHPTLKSTFAAGFPSPPHCQGSWQLVHPSVVWSAKLTQTQLLRFTEGETEAQRAFLNSVCSLSWDSVWNF